LPLPKKQHEKVRRLQTLDEVETMFPGFKAFLDATEQEIPRPKAKRKRKTHYSGKKKKHTVKTQITVNKNCLIVHKTGHSKGSTHDYTLFDYPKLNCEVPFKRKSLGRGKRGLKGQELLPEQRAFNKRLSKERVVVEHTFSWVKKFRILGDEFRNRLKHYDIMTDIVCGLVNFRRSGTTDI
jgi:transposase